MKENSTYDHQGGATYLFAIALETYQSAEMPTRHGSIQSIQEFAQLMQQRYQIAPENTIYLFNEAASEEEIDRKLIGLQDVLNEEDSLIILFSGHSFFRVQLEESYWIPYDGVKSRISTCISSAALMVHLQTIKSRHLLLMTDACLPNTVATQVEALTIDTGLVTRHFIASGDSCTHPDPSVGDFFWKTVLSYFDETSAEEASVMVLSNRLENLQKAGKLGKAFIFNYLNRDWLLRRTSQEDLYWKKVREEETEYAYKEYLATFPDGKYSSEAYQLLAEYAIQRAWERALVINTIEEYEDFMALHRKSKYDDQAKSRIADLKEGMKNFVRGGGKPMESPSAKRSISITPSRRPSSTKKAIVVKRQEVEPPSPPKDDSLRARIKIGEKAKVNRSTPRPSLQPTLGQGDIRGKDKSRTSSEEASGRFEAFPFISNPGVLKRDADFEVAIGFQEDIGDETLTQPSKIIIESPQKEEPISVVLMAEGAAIDKECQFQTMRLAMDSKLIFKGRVSPKASAVELHASYLYKGQLVGQATRHIPVIGFEPSAPDQVLFSSEPVDVLKDREPVDIHVWVKYSSRERSLVWVIQHEQVTEERKLDEVNLDDNHNIALMLRKALQANQYSGEAAWRTLKNLGEIISKLIPKAFYERLQAIAEHKSTPPRVLIITNEYYIPWELAYHYSLELDSNYLPFLNLQVELGRWLMSKPHCQELECNKLSYDAFDVVAANYNDLQFQLSNACIERERLVARFGARAVEAKREVLMSLVKNLPKKGRVLHMALHGHSGPEVSDNKLQLEDGDLMAIEWIPPRKPKELPAISFLFLNACQVGSASTVLSIAAGFPGLLLPKGIRAFVAPIWNVHDQDALKWAERFYEQVIGEHNAIGEVMLRTRREMQHDSASLTCMAYLYYGHPGLKLEAVVDDD